MDFVQTNLKETKKTDVFVLTFYLEQKVDMLGLVVAAYILRRKNILEVTSNVQVYGLEESIRGAKLPMSTAPDTLTTTLTKGIKALAQSEGGAGHDQWLTGVVVQFDLTFSVKAWTEAERYHFLDFISSQSTMHRIAKFNLDKAYMEYTDPRIVEIMKEKVKEYNEETDEEKKKILYLNLLYSNPCGFKLTARMTTNYRQLKTIYRQRRTHRLPEWQAFCDWIETLPHSELIIGEKFEN